jgi:predicted Rossmann fold flavoprotein
MQKTDIIIIGAGAAGLMCAIEAAKRQRQVIVLDHANKPGKKILMSGRGRCNFTNYHCSPQHFISHNPPVCKSALTRYTQWDFINLVKKHHIPFHEKTLGQLFCDHKSKDILNMLLTECQLAAAEIRLNTDILKIEKISDHHFKIHSSRGDFHCQSIVIATGGLSIPTMGASPFGYKVAEQFGLKVWPTRAGLVPLTLHTQDKERLSTLAGVAVDTISSTASQSFRENMLFTHRGLSGPAILQLSSYWQAGETIAINLLPELALEQYLTAQKQQQPQKQLNTILHDLLPKRLIELFIPPEIAEKKLATLSQATITQTATQLNSWHIKPNGTEGYRTAEVTLGGVDCDVLSSKTFEVTTQPGLYFIGEVLDVTGWLGGFNFQWAWSSGWAAGQVV